MPSISNSPELVDLSIKDDVLTLTCLVIDQEGWFTDTKKEKVEVIDLKEFRFFRYYTDRSYIKFYAGEKIAYYQVNSNDSKILNPLLDHFISNDRYVIVGNSFYDSLSVEKVKLEKRERDGKYSVEIMFNNETPVTVSMTAQEYRNLRKRFPMNIN